MRIVDDMVRQGDRLFRWRSYLPLLLVPAFLASVLDTNLSFGSRLVERLWELAAFGVSLAGLAVRIVAVATAPSGTSERSTRNPRAAVLRTTGLYSIVRHPLYLANILMALGLALFPGVWYLPVIVLLASGLYYERIAVREEAFLDDQFGATFRTWASDVPAMIPSRRGMRVSSTPFSWKKVIRSEFHGLMVIATGAFVLDLAQESLGGGRVTVDPLWGTVFSVCASFFAVMVVLKKATHLLDIVEPRLSDHV